MAKGGRPTAYVDASARVQDNKKKRTRMQQMAENGAGLNVNRTQKDRNNTSLADLARQYTKEAAEAKANGTFRQASLRRYATPQTRYRSNVRTEDGKLGKVQGVGTTYKKRYVAVERQPSVEQPKDSGNGNSPPTMGIGRTLKSNGVYGRVQAYLRNR